MKVIFGIGKIKPFRRAVVTLGVFDGVHRGHLKILKALIRQAKRIKGESVVVTFNPHPQSEFNLYSLEHRLRFFKQIGINACIVINFTAAFANIQPDQFIKNFLIKKIRPRYVFIGRNFTFGKSGKGNPSVLKAYSDKYNFRINVFSLFRLKGKAVSSTYIRRLILLGRISDASRLLGRPVSILGEVIRGKRLATVLGFATANLRTKHEVLPPAGVYLARIIIHQKKFYGLCYIGTRPTFKNRKKSKSLRKGSTQIEVHILGFNKNIYGKELEVQLLKKLRGEQTFPSVGSLARQVRKDIRTAYSFHRLLPK